MTAYYNEIDPFAVAWLRELIKAGEIADGEVDERSIEDVLPKDLMGFTQCHFFAGIGVWSYALRQAGWQDDRPVWSGSCPCQPFSAAGKGKGFADERHLWPAFFHLVSQCSPAIVFGEQVASKDGLSWIDLVQTDMEGSGYAFGAVDTCAAGFGAPHIRQRLYWVAERSSAGLERLPEQPAREEFPAIERGGGACGMADDYSPGLQPWERDDQRERYWNTVAAKSVTSRNGCPGPTNGFWEGSDWLRCKDGRWRPVESGTSPLVDGAPARVGRLRGYGNAINAIQAKAFIESFLEVTA